MDPKDRIIVAEVTKAILALLHGERPQAVAPGEASDDVRPLCDALNKLLGSFTDAQSFISSLSQGLLEVDPPPRNFLISPFKQLHSNLRHLTWQTKQVATGDLSQHVDFLGEFSAAFNSMIASLNEKKRVEEELRRVHLDLLEANTRVMDSIQYARTIQAAFLPNLDEMASAMDEFFVIWKPKDVIGGDIYKFKSFEDGYVVAVIDCTGHGVPGAIMTMIAGSSFDLALEGADYREPSKILERLNWLVKKALNQHYRESPSNDGLDIGVCFVNKVEKTVVFSGAGIGLHYVADGTVHEVRPDRQSIGYKSSRLNFRYTDHAIPIMARTRLYLSSDGMIHQSGGQRDLPFGKKRFKRLLSEHYYKPLQEQRSLFEQTLDTYRGEENQLDDITVLGFVLD